jgi:DNA repair protein SbcC/Rad50
MSTLVRLEVVDYQSLKRVSLPLGGVTVVTGPTGSGKSAFRRAFQLLAFNARGAGAHVRRGARRCAIALVESDGQVSRAVLLRRGAKSTAGDFYRLLTEGPDGKAAQEFTKLAGKVPDEIAAVLRLGQVNFAGQIDAPYLLAESGAEAARVLGELTNVSMVFAAAAEAGRRGKQLARDARGAQARLAGLREQAAAYEGVAERLAAVEQAQVLCGEIGTAAARLDRLRSLTSRLEAETAAAAAARQAAEETAPPDLARLEAGLAKLTRLRELIGAYAEADRAVTSWAGEVKAAADREQAAHEAVHGALVAAGQCPMCGQGVK